jgi:hypothetical protein
MAASLFDDLTIHKVSPHVNTGCITSGENF